MASNGQTAWLETEAGQHLQESLTDEKSYEGSTISSIGLRRWNKQSINSPSF
ncbi:MAG: hypothetical protein AAF242_07525 [Bacteroidota bacterium]